MKCTVTPEELSNFLEKLKREIEADYMIMEATKPSKDSLNNLEDTLTAIHQIGIKQGSIDGRMNVVNKFLDFFEI